MRLKLFFASAVLAAAAIAPAVANAEVLYDNIGAPTAASDAAASAGPLYNSFSTGATGPTISQFDLLLSGTAGDGGTFQVQILTDNPGSGPGSTALFTSGAISDNILSTAVTDVNFSFAGVILAASNRYWIGLTGDALSSVQWAWTIGNGGTGVAGEYYANTLGGPFSNDDAIGAGEPYQMRVTDAPAVSTTPLPGALPLFATGLGALGVVGWRRKRKARAA